MSKKISMILTVLSLVLGLVLCLGAEFLFSACGADEDGSYMRCHWAQMAVVAVAAVLIVIYVLALLVRDARVRAGLVLATVPMSVAVMLIPGTVIGLCMMATMHCRAMLRPACLVLGLVMAVIALIHGLLLIKGEKKDVLSK